MLLFNTTEESPQKAYAFSFYPTNCPPRVRCHGLDNLVQYSSLDTFYTRPGQTLKQLDLHTDLKSLFRRLVAAFPYTLENESFDMRLYSYFTNNLKKGEDRYYIPVKDCQLIREFKFTYNNIQSYYDSL